MRFVWLAAGAIVCAPSTAQEPAAAISGAAVIARWPAEEARQGVAADSRFFYPNGNNLIGKYDKKTGRRVARWEGPRARFPHMNSCVVDRGELVCAASNYPAVPMASVIEVFDTGTLKHLRSIALPPLPGSLTWIERRGTDWYGAFANYPEGRGGEAGRDHRWTRLVRFDPQFRATGSWLFPATVLDRFAPMSSSGGSWGTDGLLYVTGHDRPELYVLRLPEAGTVLDHIATIPLSTRGQAVTWDRSQARVLWSLDRETKTVVATRIPPVAIR
jgi:hypothetical protein